MTKEEKQELKNIIESIARKSGVDIQQEEISERDRMNFVKELEKWLERNR